MYGLLLITKNTGHFTLFSFNNNYLGIFLIQSFLFGLMVILLFPNSSVNHFFVLFLLLFITALIDVAAYLVGSSIGRTPLFQDLSPNKTLEGFIGSVVMTTLFLSTIYWLEFISWNLFLVLIAVIPFAFIGDYFESHLKRNQQIKDSGSLIPGHGGIWDRLDSHMAIIPVFCSSELFSAMKNVVLLGATGSIGSSTLNVLRQNKEIFTLKAIALHQNLDIALEIVREFNPEHVFISDKNINIDHPIFSSGSKIVTCLEDLKSVIQNPAIEIVISAISGFAGLQSSYWAIEAGKTTLIANKESIVSAGDILIPLAAETKAKIIPVDSEHNAIYQCLLGEKDTSAISTILITASGGPFRRLSMQELETVSLQDALQASNLANGV